MEPASRLDRIHNNRLVAFVGNHKLHINRLHGYWEAQSASRLFSWVAVSNSEDFTSAANNLRRVDASGCVASIYDQLRLTHDAGIVIARMIGDN